MTSVELSLTTSDSWAALERLWQLYRHDLSEFRGTTPDAQGLFPLGHLPLYYDDPDRHAYLIHSDDILAGFALVRGLSGDTRVLGEFFIIRAARRSGLGYTVAATLLHQHPGPWEIAFQEANPTAARLWRRIAADVGEDVREGLRPVPDKPDVEFDVWITLQVP